MSYSLLLVRGLGVGTEIGGAGAGNSSSTTGGGAGMAGLETNFQITFAVSATALHKAEKKSHISSQKYQIAAIATTARIIYPMEFQDTEVPAVVALAKKPLCSNCQCLLHNTLCVRQHFEEIIFSIFFHNMSDSGTAI